MRNMSVRQPASIIGGTSSVLSRHGSTAATRRVTLVFNNLQPAELAEQLTFLEYKAFRRITVRLNAPACSFATPFCFFPDDIILYAVFYISVFLLFIIEDQRFTGL